jgi:hypothetical protein
MKRALQNFVTQMNHYKRVTSNTFKINNYNEMKIINKVIAVFVVLIFCTACIEEEMIVVNPDFTLTFQRDGRQDASAGTPFYVIPTGSGEFITLFDGTDGHVWGEEGAKGIDFNKADSLLVQYNDAGKYKLTLVASSAGNFGKEFSRMEKTVEVNVVDNRNSFTVFNINETDGEFAPNNEILFSVPDIVTDFNFVAVYGLQSNLSKVFVGGIEQTSSVTVNDFSKPVVYTVKSAQGDEKIYTVKFSTFAASSEKALTRFALGVGGNGEVGIINEETKEINLISNYATNLASVRLILQSSYGSKILINNVAYSDRRNYDLAKTVKAVKVVAQNNSEVEYAIKTVLDSPVTTFTFEGLVPAPVGVIDATAKTITVDVLKGTDVTKLIAKWKGSVGKVTIGNATQTNGVTVNNFSKPLTYTFYKGTTAGDKYTVTVNVK